MDNLQLRVEHGVKYKGENFTRLMGGFGEDKACITIKQIAELLDRKIGHVNEVINRNIYYFQNELHIMDLKSAIVRRDNEFLTTIGYTQNAYNASKNIYILSQAGFLLYLKFAEGDKAVEIYKNFIEDYFQAKAENQNMKATITEQIESLKQEKAKLYGMSILESDDIKRAMIFRSVENMSESITQLEKSLTEEETIKKLQSRIEIANKISDSNKNYDVGVFSKILGIKEFGRNKLFDWMRQEKILMNGNVPYQSYLKYFSVVPVVNPHNNMVNDKTLIKPCGIDFLVKRLIKSGKIIPKSVEQIKEELDTM